MLSTQDYLRIVAPYLPNQLISSQHVEKIGRIAARLPPSSNFGFECKLGSAAQIADFLIAVIPSDGSRGAWVGENPLTEVPPQGSSTSPWRKVRTFFDDWHGDDFLAPIQDTWLEFDVDDSVDALPEPSFFFGFDDAEPANYPELTLELIERLRRSPLPVARRQMLETCYRMLPANGIIFQVGLMLARSTEEVRLCARRMKPAEILTFLEDIGWSGSSGELAQLLDRLSSVTDGVNLDISVGTAVAPSIGLECTIRSGREGRAKAQRMLQQLTIEGACREEKAEALFQWLGYCNQETDRSRWPAHLLKAAQGLPAGVSSTFARTLNHVKLTFESGRPITAKAYLGVRHFWARTMTEASS